MAFFCFFEMVLEKRTLEKRFIDERSRNKDLEVKLEQGKELYCRSYKPNCKFSLQLVQEIFFQNSID